MPDILEGKNQSIPQDDSKATFASNISRADERVDWQRNAQEIHNHIRGLAPWPVAYTTMDDKNMKILLHISLKIKLGNQEQSLQQQSKQSLLVRNQMMLLQ